VRKWIKEDLKPMVDQCLDPEKLRRQGVFDPAAVQELVRLNNADKVDASYAIWSLLAIESWIRQFIGE
jgi:asparagine synthase (glutamine-hydrolysing)